jgi:NAD(P)H-hydrate epimerase
MQILSAEQTRQADAYTIKNEPITSIELMERASLAFAQHFSASYSKKKTVAVVCGTGNNGGDGLAISRILQEKGYNVSVFIARAGEGGSPDFLTNLARLAENRSPTDICSPSDIPGFEEYDLIIDAIFGSGLARPVTGLFGEIILAMNASRASIIAVDIASGLYCDHPPEGSCIVEPDLSISFQLPKLAFLIPANFKFVGEWVVVDIGLDQQYINSLNTPYQLLDHGYISSLFLPRNKFDHKGTYGHGLLIGGSYGKIGAMVLAASAFIRSGAGLLTTNIPRCGYNILQTTVPESMVIADKSEHIITESKFEDRYFAVGIGPGLGTAADTAKALKTLLLKIKNPAVLDADALNLLARKSELPELLPEKSILTPHPKEFARLAGESASDWDRLEKVKSFAARHKVILILKGAHTAIACPDGKIYFNNTGNPGMATGGSGDVLTGVLTALLTQGYKPGNAASLGVYVHGLAGDLAATDLGETSLTASDIINYLPEAFHSLT